MTAARPRPRRLPAFGWFALAFAAVLAVGHTSVSAFGFPGALLIPGAALPPLAAISVAMGRVGGHAPLGRIAAALAIGFLLSTIAAVLLSLLAGALVWALVVPIRDTLLDLSEARHLDDLFRSPAVLIAFVDLAVVAPVVEELAKPLAVLLLIRWIGGRREAFLVGMAGDVGFAFAENLLYEGAFFSGQLWAPVTLLRGLGGALHPLTAGLVGLGYYEVLRGRAGGPARLAAYYALAVGLHAAWNGGLVVLETIVVDYDDGWRLNVYGEWLPGTLLTFLVLMSVLLWSSLVVAASRLRGPRAASPEPLLALHIERADRLALAGAGLMAAVIPIGALWSPLITHQIEIAFASG